MNRVMFWVSLVIVAAIYIVITVISSKQVGVSEVVLIFVCVPRLHDIGKSGWFALIGVAIEMVGIAVGLAFFPFGQFPVAMGVAGVIILGLIIWLGLARGDPNPNAWGDPPAPGIQFKAAPRPSN
jgi:uncharacterized membrane protein YhaH (DUF805 family)